MADYSFGDCLLRRPEWPAQGLYTCVPGRWQALLLHSRRRPQLTPTAGDLRLAGRGGAGDCAARITNQ